MELEQLSDYKKNAVINGLLLYSKYLGCYAQLKQRLKENNIRLYHPKAIDAFLRILSVSNTSTEDNTLTYYKNIQQYLRPNEQLYSRFLLFSGLRVSEAIHSFNLILELSRNGKLCDYYKEDWSILQHFKYPSFFIRGNKNAYLTFLRKDFLMQIANSEPISYDAMKLRLQRANQNLQMDTFRDWFGSYMVNSRTLTELEQNLVCGRCNGIFVRHYWNAELTKMGERIFKALDNRQLI